VAFWCGRAAAAATEIIAFFRGPSVCHTASLDTKELTGLDTKELTGLDTKELTGCYEQFAALPIPPCATATALVNAAAVCQTGSGARPGIRLMARGCLKEFFPPSPVL
jgi:hypothetical protein